MLAYLKIKIVSLAAEARLIRAAERKWKKRRKYLRLYGQQAENIHADAVFLGLKDHRATVVRDEARWAQIAYGFLRGLRYDQVERPVRKKRVNERRIVELVCKYCRDSEGMQGRTEPEIRSMVQKWLQA